MRKKNVLVIVLTALVFLSAAVLGVSTVYRVDEVTLYADCISDEAQAEATALRGELLKAYDKQSIFTTDDTLAETIVEEYPYFNLTAFEKEYPNRLSIRVKEEAEAYACATQDGKYYILSEEGTVLGIRDDYKNRSDGEDNLLIEGLTVTGERGEKLTGEDCLSQLFPFLKAVSTRLNGIRRNISSVKVIFVPEEMGGVMFRLSAREGVNLYVGNPSALADQKAETLVNEYTGLSSEQKLTGMLRITDVSGEIHYDYYREDTLGA